MFCSCAGDGCFYVGLGGKSSFPKNSFEPYQCCPSKPSKGTKVAKATPSPKKSVQKSPPKPAKPVPKLPSPKPAPAKETKKESPAKPFAKAFVANKNPKEAKEAPSKGKEASKTDKGKGKKGFFGTGKYIWWW